MTLTNIKYSCLLILLLLSVISAQQKLKRDRNEGTSCISASNVAGNGNISISSSLNANYLSKGFEFDPLIDVKIGIADFLQLKACASFVNFKKLGSSFINLQITTPGNNNLRFFGIALCGNLFLSTNIDTVTGEAISNRPDYHSFIRPSLIADLDWIALNKKCKLKTYFQLGMVDNKDLLNYYNQLSIMTGFEWKMFQNSIVMDIGMGLYKEKKNKSFVGDNSFEQHTLWIQPGFRYRIAGRLCILGSCKITVLHKIKPDRPMPSHYASLNLSFDFPIVYKETNTEAIRSLIYIEQVKEKSKDRITRSIESGKKIKTDFEMDFQEFNTDNLTDEQQKESLKKKEEIQQKMDNLENLLKELE